MEFRLKFLFCLAMVQMGASFLFGSGSRRMQSMQLLEKDLAPLIDIVNEIESEMDRKLTKFEFNQMLHKYLAKMLNSNNVKIKMINNDEEFDSRDPVKLNAVVYY